MGWGSGVYVFDGMVEAILVKEVDDSIKESLIISLIDVLTSEDWDTETDSRFIDHPIVRNALIAGDSTWKEYFEEED